MPHSSTPHCTCLRCLDDHYSRFDLTLTLQQEGRRVIKINDIPLISTYDPTEARKIMDALGITLSIYKKCLIHTKRLKAEGVEPINTPLISAHNRLSNPIEKLEHEKKDTEELWAILKLL